MSDETGPGGSGGGLAPLAADIAARLREFDEQRYLQANPDVAEGVRLGVTASGREHFLRYGVHEGRDMAFAENDPKDVIIETPSPAAEPRSRAAAAHSVESVVVTRSGAVMIVGWIDDTAQPLDSVGVIAQGWRIRFDAGRMARHTRPDVAEALGRPAAHAYGFLGFVFGATALRPQGRVEVHLRSAGGDTVAVEAEPRVVEDAELFRTLLWHLAGGHNSRTSTADLVAPLVRGLGDQIVGFNNFIVAPMVKSPHVERFGPPGRRPRASIVVCIYGRPEYHFIQNALFSGKPGIEDHEFIYVSNSPELAEVLLSEARSAQRIYGLSQTLVLLPGNAGFGAANNVAVKSARSDRIVILNPDVFPKDPAWARNHLELLEARPRSQTDLFGSSLYYDDGSLMHGGMFFELDKGLAFHNNRKSRWQLLRVEHYGKGAPPDTPAFTRSRPVPAVTGAFISLARPWFETLGGFTEDYVFGHYEDADLCLKSLQAGTAPWLHDLKLWHLEGKGSTRAPVHDSASHINRWLFSSRWGGFVTKDLLGPSPTYGLLDPDAAPEPAPAGARPARRGAAKMPEPPKDEPPGKVSAKSSAKGAAKPAAKPAAKSAPKAVSGGEPA